MKKAGTALLVLAVLGCAKLNVETKEPLKVDINMRIDVYQHVAKDVESINDQIYGGKEKKFNALFDFATAYAVDLSADAQSAIARRKARAAKVEEYLNQGHLGENRQALLEIRTQASAELEELVAQENKDREILYQYTAEKNGVDVLEVRKVFLQDDYQRAPSGWWFEVQEGDQYLWKQKNP